MSSSKFVIERVEIFLPRIVESLDIYLQVPHTNVIRQGDGNDDLDGRLDEDTNFYFVGKGICKITIKDRRGKEIFVRNIH